MTNNTFLDVHPETSKRGQLAKSYFLEGYNCTQAVVLAFKDYMPEIHTSTLLKMVSSFGGGMARLREVCGSVSGMFFVAGYLYGYDGPKDQAGKTEHYKRIQFLANEFSARLGSIVCRDLLGLNVKKQQPTPEVRTKEYYKKRPCPDIVALSAAIMEAYIEKCPIED